MSSPMSEVGLASRLEAKKHTSFFLRCLRLLPQPYTSADDQRMTLGYFALSGLDLLHSLDKIHQAERTELIEWVYDQQPATGGFRGSPSSSRANVAMTYAALLILAILKDDFQRLNRKGLLRFVGALQDQAEGGFAAEEETEERDPRFTYCAVAICSMLNEWQGINAVKAKRYLEGCQRYDGGFGASATHESHSGMTYCCIAALHLLPPSEANWEREEEALSWLVHRQVAPSSIAATTESLAARASSSTSDADDDSDDDDKVELTGGFQGRPSKLPPDVCYSFWNGAALSLLSQHALIDAVEDAGYVLSAQSKVGGIAKVPDEHPDLLHSYLGLASLALHQGEVGFGLKELDAGWNCSAEAKEWIQRHLGE